MNTRDIKNLKFRYLLWLYKTTKEALERIERKFTQLDIDKEIFKYIFKHLNPPRIKDRNRLNKLLKEFAEYINKKQKDGLDLKFTGKKLKPECYFILLKLQAIEKVIIKQLGQQAKDKISFLYEQEMRKRILESQKHH